MTLKNSDDDEISILIEKLKPYAGKITFGTLVGYCSGAAAKKIGKLIAVLTGVAFIFIQTGKFQVIREICTYKYGFWIKGLTFPSTAASYNYIQVDW